MCWNASVSLNTYIFGLFASLFSYYNKLTTFNDVIFYQSIIIIQLIEYFIWSETFSNKLLSQIALLIILSQPVFNILTIEKKPELIPYLLAAYLIFITVLYTLVIPLNTVSFSSVPSENGHLSWNWMNCNLFIVIIWYIFLASRWVIDNMYLPLISITILLIITIVLFSDTNTWGSLWCWICNITSLYFIMIIFYNNICQI